MCTTNNQFGWYHSNRKRNHGFAEFFADTNVLPEARRLRSYCAAISLCRSVASNRCLYLVQSRKHGTQPSNVSKSRNRRFSIYHALFRSVICPPIESSAHCVVINNLQPSVIITHAWISTS